MGHDISRFCSKELGVEVAVVVDKGGTGKVSNTLEIVRVLLEVVDILRCHVFTFVNMRLVRQILVRLKCVR